MLAKSLEAYVGSGDGGLAASSCDNIPESS